MNTNTTITTPRDNWIDSIKIFSTLLIFFNHGLPHVWSTYPMDTITWKLVHCFFLLSRVAVPLFFICSGAGMLRKEHSFSQIFYKNIFQLLKIYICWMLIYGVVSCISLYQENLASLHTCVNALVKSVLFGQYHTWFIFTLLSLYMITPFLYLITRTRENMQYFLFLSLIFTVFIPMLNSFDFLSRLTNTLDNFNMYFVYGYILYYVAGYYLSTVCWKKIYSYIAIAVFITSFGFAYMYSINVSISSGTPYQHIFSEFSPFLCLTVLSVYGIFRGFEIRFPSELTKPLLSFGFALYLMHPLFLKYVKQISGPQVFPAVIVLYFSCIFICFIVSKSRILSKLFLK